VVRRSLAIQREYAVKPECTVRELKETVELSASSDARPGSPSTDAQGLPPVFGRYRVERLLGRGGMGSVYLARDQQLSRPVALKIPRITPGQSDKYLARLKREALSVAALHHPNICAVYDAGEIAGIHYLAMPYINGRPLTEYMQSGKQQSERAAALTVFKIAKALEEAHHQGILHRDLKPANIMIDSRGEPIVMDFGLASRLSDGMEGRVTQEGAIVGTPEYMAPELFDRDAAIGPASDIYSLGVVLYELLTQQRPFAGSTVGVVGQVLHSEPPPIESLRPKINPEMARICRTAMAKNPAERFGSMREFADALSAFIRGKYGAGLAPLPALTDIDDQLLSAPLASLGPAKSLSVVPGLDLPPHLKWLIVAAAVVIVVLLVAMLVFGH
jgi:serine/threonine-protein kinase